MRRVATIPMAAGLAITLCASTLAGPLNPPSGPVTPTPGPEPRTPINATNTPGDNDATPSTFKISQPGSYYLTGNLTGESGKMGIEIAAPNVSLDLNGFAVQGVNGSLDGIATSVADLTGLSVRNGTVTGWIGDGIDLGNSTAYASTVESVAAVQNLGMGIIGGTGARVARCTAHANGRNGIRILPARASKAASPT